MTRRQWLSAAFASRTQHVLVIGAGMAGLAAALDLADRGLAVTVLEASDHPGGRVRTLRAPFRDGQFAEAGASRIPDTHELTLRYVRRFSLTLDPFYPAHGHRMYLLRGKRFPHPLDLKRAPVRLTPSERKSTLDELWERYVMAPGRRISPEQADRITFTRFLKDQGASQGAQELLWLPWERPREDRSSALWSLQDALGDEHEKTRYKIRGGNDQLPRAMAAALGGRIRYSVPVTRIAQHASGIEVTAAGQLFRADFAVVTVPFPVLRGVVFEPALSASKMDAIRNLRYDSVVRTCVQFPSRPWEQAGWNGFATTGHPDDLWHPTHDHPAPSAILMSYMLGSRARAASQIPAARHVDSVLKRMSAALGPLPAPLASTVVDWDKEPWARGAFAFQAPGQILGMRAVSASPEGRIHFAGEHTSSRPSWMMGAIESGLRAAAEIGGLL
ncbi:MAG: FAD-dependent oxidoreductase [Acidobacteria bacterium]|nr:FAD-dependent oxidoreductase [Acidobacteriota bacterium]